MNKLNFTIISLLSLAVLLGTILSPGIDYVRCINNIQANHIGFFYPLTDADTAARETVRYWNGYHQYNTIQASKLTPLQSYKLPFYDGVFDHTKCLLNSKVISIRTNYGTVMCWAKVSSMAMWTNDTQTRSMFGIINGAREIMFVKMPASAVGSVNDGRLRVFIDGGPTALCQSTVTWFNTNWFQVVMTYKFTNGTGETAVGTMAMYTNGVFVSNTPLLGAWTFKAVNRMNIGTSLTSSLEFWSGNLGFYGYWRTNWNAAEVRKSYNAMVK